MIARPRSTALLALAVLLFTLPLAAQQNPWDAPAFSSEPAALLAAANRVATDDYSVVMLLDEAEYVVGEDGQTKSRERIMLYVVTDAGVDWSSEVRAPWAPWHDERPSIEARVVTKDGNAVTLDQNAVVEVPAGEEADIFSDGRVLRAPLPAVAPGSVIEYVISRAGKNPIPGAGTAIHYHFGGYLPVERTRVSIDAPLTIDPRLINKTGVEPRVEEKDGRRRTIFEAARIEGTREIDDYVPYDVAVRRYIAFSTGKSWKDIANSYSAIVDKQIADADLQKLVRTAIGTSTDRKEVVDKLLAAIQKDIRYAGIEIGEGSIVPRTPKQVLANHYGDCKDKASLLVAMLRIAGFPAHVALLNAGEGFDSHPDLPALNYFNHAITVVDGDSPIWVDPTDVYARAGELPLLDQGRMALIAKPETTGLTRTPEIESSAHVYRELRTFYLPEDGKGRVVEVTEPSATSEGSLRRWVSGFDPKKLREQIEDYAKSAYVAKTITRYDTTDPKDLTKPFRLTVEVPESGSSVVNNGEAAVVINIASLPQNIPNALRDWKEVEPGTSPDDAPKTRTHDFLFPQPGVREWVYRIVPPAGYAPRTLPSNETKKLGTMTFTQDLRTEADNTVVATFRFDSGKRRISKAEFDESRIAFTKFVTDNTVTIGFEMLGQTKLNAGDVRGALDEFRRLAALHPKEAQHHIEIARALLAGGLGDAAREEIRRAIAIEPKNARAHEMHGTILLYDSLGRPYRKGFDRDGAVAAYRKAKELDPDDYGIRAALVSALSYGDDGYRFSRGARLAEAVTEVEAVVKDLGESGKPMLPELTLLYAHMGRFEELRKFAPTLEDDQQRDLAKIIATAAIDGADAAVRELGAFDLQRKRSYASGVGQTLMSLRLYPQTAVMMELATQGTPQAAEQRQFIDLLKKMKRIEELPADDSARSVIAKFFDGLLYKDGELIKQLFPAEYLTDPEDERDITDLDFRSPDEFLPAVFRDLLALAIDVQQEGDDETGYRLRMRAMAGGPMDEMSFIVLRENGKWVIRGVTNAIAMNGTTVLAFAEKGQLEAARKWLNWTRDDAKGGTSDDPLDGEPFAALWSKAKATATLDEIRIAAASLATDKIGGTKSEPVLLAAREQATTDAAKSAIDHALVAVYRSRKDWPKMLDATTRLVAANPDSGTAFSLHVEALLRNTKSADATTFAQQRLDRIPGDRDAVSALALAAAETGDYAAAQKYAVKVVDELRPKNDDFTRAAWIALFTGDQLERAIEHAQRAAKQSDDDKPHRRQDRRQPPPALAALYAETGRSVEARTALLAGIDGANRGVLHDGDWYVLGRIAENYGVDDYAITAYRKVKQKGEGAASVDELAKRRLEGLTKKKK